MKIKLGVIFAWILALSVTLWIWSGIFLKGPATPEVGAAAPIATLSRVQTEWKLAEPMVRYITLNGRTAAKRSITVKSETSGKILTMPFEKGATVVRGDLIARIDTADLPARITSSKALEEQRRQEFLATQKLVDQGFQNATQLATVNAFYQQAKAQTISLAYQLAYTDIRAPFDAVINRAFVNAGSVIRNGDFVVELVDFSTLKVIADVSENDIGYINLGDEASIELVHGESAIGKATYIDSEANAATRTFSVEFEITQKLNRPMSGSSAVIQVPLPSAPAHFISPALLILDNDGKLGIKTLNRDGYVEFHNIDIIESTPRGIWVSGLPERTQIITVGQGFVISGQQAVAVPSTTTANPQ